MDDIREYIPGYQTDHNFQFMEEYNSGVWDKDKCVHYALAFTDYFLLALIATIVYIIISMGPVKLLIKKYIPNKKVRMIVNVVIMFTIVYVAFRIFRRYILCKIIEITPV